jgi:NAD+ synthase (glutamine-hydrolysing)
MRLVRIALANVNATVGACRSNVDRAVDMARAAAADHATLVAMPEQVVEATPGRSVAGVRAGPTS